MATDRKLGPPGKKKLLALDGGGIRGAMTIEVLAGIETMIRREFSNDALVLADYFDFVGGTSTGAILAAAISKGMSTQKLRIFYEQSGPAMFDKASLLKRFRYKYGQESLAGELKEVFGAETNLGSDELKTMLVMVMRNATTDSPWPVSNNPKAKYNNTGDDNDNLRIPLWQLIRASTAAPVYFPPEEIVIGKNTFLFVDGGVTMFNNPAFQMFLMATMPAYGVKWPTGDKDMLIVSVGTGHAAAANADLDASDMNLLYNAGSVPSALMAAALHQQDMLCRAFGKCLLGDSIDREIGDMIAAQNPGGQSLFTYMRYNAELTDDGLSRLGLSGIDPERVRELDSVNNIGDLQEIGKAVAKLVDRRHFGGFLK
ncbi:MAG: patatin-like phospholipase family protein [Planctomycetota bacterium]